MPQPVNRDLVPALIIFVLHNQPHTMNRTETVKDLAARVNKSAQSSDALMPLFEEYKSLLSETVSADSEYRVALRRFSEELTDLQRLADKKYFPILKGRIIDGLSAMRKKAEELEASAAPVSTDQQTSTADGQSKSITPEVKPPTRNMPTIGMD